MPQSLEEFTADLERMSNDFCTDLREPLADCQEIILEGVKENFTGSHSSTGYPWPARKDNKPHPLLILTGELMAAATGGDGSIGRVLECTSLEIGVDMTAGKSGRPWAEIHQEGGKRIPARSFLGFSEPVLAACEDVLTEYAIREFCGQ